METMPTRYLRVTAPAGGSQYGLKIHIQTMSAGLQLWMGGSEYELVKIHNQTMTTRNQCAATPDSRWGDLNMGLLKPIFKPCPPRAPNGGSQYGNL
jgi:hypothetical protein